MDSLRSWAEWTVRWAADNPWSFLYMVLLVLSPLFLVSAFLSWKLARDLNNDQRKNKAKQKRIDNIRATKHDGDRTQAKKLRLKKD